jgi:hypothetical protein
VRPLVEELLKKKNSIWFDIREMNAGDSISKEIVTALENSHTVLMMWSKSSQISRWSRDELNAAILLGKRIIPCRLDDTPLPKRFQATDILYLDLWKLNEQAAAELLKVIQKDFDPQSPTRMEIEKIPFHRNPNFTGREEQLQSIEKSLNKIGSVAVVAVAGLGGVGKTELAVEYTYRHAADYKEIWWLRSEGAATLAINFASIAHKLKLPEKDEKDQDTAIKAVIRWLENNDDWLLIFDNAEELKRIKQYLPEQARGHILITSRNPAWGAIANVIKLKEWIDRNQFSF